MRGRQKLDGVFSRPFFVRLHHGLHSLNASLGIELFLNDMNGSLRQSFESPSRPSLEAVFQVRVFLGENS